MEECPLFYTTISKFLCRQFLIGSSGFVDEGVIRNGIFRKFVDEDSASSETRWLADCVRSRLAIWILLNLQVVGFDFDICTHLVGFVDD